MICETPHVEICQGTQAVQKMPSPDISFPSPSPKILNQPWTRLMQMAWGVQYFKTRSTRERCRAQAQRSDSTDFSHKAFLKPSQMFTSLAAVMAAGHGMRVKLKNQIPPLPTTAACKPGSTTTSHSTSPCLTHIASQLNGENILQTQW